MTSSTRCQLGKRDGSRPSASRRRSAPVVRPSPQHLSRGNVALSMTTTSAPPRASVMAAAAPAGPAPTTTTFTCYCASLRISSKPSCRQPTNTSGSGHRGGVRVDAEEHFLGAGHERDVRRRARQRAERELRVDARAGQEHVHRRAGHVRRREVDALEHAAEQRRREPCRQAVEHAGDRRGERQRRLGALLDRRVRGSRPCARRDRRSSSARRSVPVRTGCRRHPPSPCRESISASPCAVRRPSTPWCAW